MTSARGCAVSGSFLAVLIHCGVVSAEQPPDFAKDVRPILEARCLKCHGSTGKIKGGLDLRTKGAILQGSTNGPVLVPGASGKSRLLEVLSEGEMPPKPEPALNAAQANVIKAWIDAGAPGELATAGTAPGGKITEEHRRHWAFRPLEPTSLPKTKVRVGNPVDAFVAARLESAGLAYGPEADRAKLARRITLDLLGLPPSPDEVDAFVNDSRPDGYERLVDRLLASPRFGERWARHWLDEAGYVDVIGTDNDAAIIALSENKWRYRDYVVGALNEDLPFDRFLVEQIAGDELSDWRSMAEYSPETSDQLVATGFLRTAADDTDANELNRNDVHHAILQRTGEVLVSTLLGLTLQCAKCHDHKYEPILQTDYYRLMAVLQPAFNPDSWRQPKARQVPDKSPASRAAAARQNQATEAKAAALRADMARLKAPFEARLRDRKFAEIPDAIRADTRQAIETSAEKRNPVQKYLAAKFERQTKVLPDEVTASLGARDSKQLAELTRQLAALPKLVAAVGSLQVVYDVGAPTPTHLFRRGDLLTPGPEVKPGIPKVLASSESDETLVSKQKAGVTSGRRLALARRLNDAKTPIGALALRVRVNRVWQHLFGVGIVESSDNFGVTGTPPTHPELLEWLASNFDANGLRLKPLVRLLVTSAAYRQSSARSPARDVPPSADPDNRLLGRQRLRRLEAEAVRDSILAVSGRLDPRAGGPPVPVTPKPDGTYEVPDRTAGGERRSLYLLARRNYHPTILSVFDQPNLTANCTRRTASAVVLQPLTMLNDRFLLEQSAALAARLRNESATGSVSDQVDRAFRLVLARPPRPEEANWSADLLDRHAQRYRAAGLSSDAAELKALAHLAQVLFNTSEFVYIP